MKSKLDPGAEASAIIVSSEGGSELGVPAPVIGCCSDDARDSNATTDTTAAKSARALPWSGSGLKPIDHALRLALLPEALELEDDIAACYALLLTQTPHHQQHRNRRPNSSVRICISRHPSSRPRPARRTHHELRSPEAYGRRWAAPPR